MIVEYLYQTVVEGGRLVRKTLNYFVKYWNQECIYKRIAELEKRVLLLENKDRTE